MMERVDLSRPGRRLEIDTDMPGVSTDIVRLAAQLQPHAGAARERAPPLRASWSSARRRRSASASRATCTTRSTSRSPPCCCASRRPPRTPRQTLKDQLAEMKQLADQAMGELLDLARQLRPTALDDHGLVAALRTHVRDFDRRGPARASFWADPRLGELSARRPGRGLPGRPGGARERVPPLRGAAHRGQPRALRLARPAPGRRQRLRVCLRRGGQGPRAWTACASGRCSSAARSRSTPGPGKGTTVTARGAGRRAGRAGRRCAPVRTEAA